MNYVQTLEKTRTILMDELSNVTSAIADGADDMEHWIERLRNVNQALQGITKMQASRVLILDEDQYEVMRALLAFHEDNDDYGIDQNAWPYDKATLQTLVARLDNLEAQK